MNIRERFLKVFNFEKPDRMINWEQGFWENTMERWWKEGLPKGMHPHEYFNMDYWKIIGGLGMSQLPERWKIRTGGKDDYRFYRFCDYSFIDYSPKFEEKVIEDTSEYTVFQDAQGITRKDLKKETSMVMFINNPVETREDFEMYRERFDPEDDSRYVEGFEEILTSIVLDQDIPLRMTLLGFYGHCRWMFGPEKALFNFAAEPDLIHEVMEFWGDFLIENTKRLLESSVPVDFLTIWEDMSYKGGSLISPKHFREFILPQYKRVTSFLKKNGVKKILVDSDGDINDLLPLLIEGGIDAMYPFEVAADMDIRVLKKQYPDFIFMGNIDKRAVADGEDALKREMEAKMPSVRGGGYIPSFDHWVPEYVSFEDFTKYQRMKTEISQKYLTD